MAGTGKSVKLFNLEDRKNQSGTAITEVDIFQWKNTLLDNLKREPDFVDHCKETSKWDVEKVSKRGFVDTVAGDGSAEKKAEQVHSMLTKIASYAPKTIVREITRRTKCLADVWNIARDWAGLQSSGSKHLDYYKTKMSYLKVDKEETKQEFFYRLRDAMEDTLILKTDNIKDEGEMVNVDEDMTPTVKSLVVLDWLDAIGGPALVEHVHRVYAKELETVTLSSLQTRIWKNLDSLMKEIDSGDIADEAKVFQMNAKDEASYRQVGNFRGRGRGNFGRQPDRSSNFKPFQQRSRGGSQAQMRGGFRGQNQNRSSFCKLCKASGSPNFKSHDISECWLLDERDRSNITKAHAKAQALFATEEFNTETDIAACTIDYDAFEEEEEEEDDENYNQD